MWAPGVPADACWKYYTYLILKNISFGKLNDTFVLIQIILGVWWQEIVHGIVKTKICSKLGFLSLPSMIHYCWYQHLKSIDLLEVGQMSLTQFGVFYSNEQARSVLLTRWISLHYRHMSPRIPCKNIQTFHKISFTKLYITTEVRVFSGGGEAIIQIIH